MQVKIKQIEGLQGIIDTPVSMGVVYSQSFNVSLPSTGNDFETGVIMDYTPFTDSVIQVQVNGLAVEGSYVNKLGAFYLSNDGGITVKSIANLELGDKLYWNGIIKGYQLEIGDIITISYEKEYLSYGSISGSASIPVVSGGGLTGKDYVYVSANGTPEENAIELQAAYDLAKVKVDYQESIQPVAIDNFYYSSGYLQIDDSTLFAQNGGPIQDNVVYELLFDGVSYFAYTPWSGMFWEWPDGIYPTGNGYTTLSILVNTITYNLVTVVVAPGKYSFASDFLVDTEHISIVSLTGNADVLFTGNSGINITADGIKVKGIDVINKKFTIGNLLGSLIIENCKGGNNSFGDINSHVTSTFIDCLGKDYCFSGGFGNSICAGTYTNCIGGSYSFGGYSGTASGTFIGCKSEMGSFGRFASGTFIDCAGYRFINGVDYSYQIGGSFGSIGEASGVFENCKSATFGGLASGSFSNCHAYQLFGSSSSTLTGKLYYCRQGFANFFTVSNGGRTYYCIDGNGNTNNQ